MTDIATTAVVTQSRTGEETLPWTCGVLLDDKLRLIYDFKQYRPVQNFIVVVHHRFPPNEMQSALERSE